MSPTPATLVAGRIEGTVTPDGRVRSFFGVPYAQPPVGALRWRPPQPLQRWSGVRAADRFAASAPQPAVATSSLYFGGERTFSEDCLYVNVWTGPTGAPLRPVLVWFHFGGFQFGSAANPLYDGTVLAREGATVVGVNYRLGRAGWMAHPALSAESDHGVSGNYGLLDQVAALRWVRDNIESLGGDPTRVTVAGLSAGGHSVHNLRACDQAVGLFHRAIAQSAPGVAPVRNGPGHPANPQSLAAAEEAGSEVAGLLGVRTAAQLRAVPVDALAAVELPRRTGRWTGGPVAGAPVSMHSYDSAYPVVDGHVLRESPLTAYQHGRAGDVPMIVGTSGNEGAGLPWLTTRRDYENYVDDEYGSHAERVHQLYPARTDAEAPAASRALEGDRVFVWSAWTAARLAARTSPSPVWHYTFERHPPMDPDGAMLEGSSAGAFHGAELPYLFGTFDVWRWPWTAADHELGRSMRAAWLAFAATGDPSSPESDTAVPTWPAFTEQAPSSLVWNLPTRVASSVIHRRRMDLFDDINGLKERAT